MKKLLVLMLMLGLATSANAMVLEIGDAQGNPLPDSEIYLLPSEEIILTIVNPGVQDEDLYVAIVVDTTIGTLSGGAALKPPAPSLTTWPFGNAAGAFFPGLNANEDGPYGSIASSPGETGGPGIYISDILFHCELKDVDAVVRLLGTADFGTARVLDTLIIHQVPEPMTVALLGMGGLFLLRRRK